MIALSAIATLKRPRPARLMPLQAASWSGSGREGGLIVPRFRVEWRPGREWLKDGCSVGRQFGVDE